MSSSGMEPMSQSYRKRQKITKGVKENAVRKGPEINQLVQENTQPRKGGIFERRLSGTILFKSQCLQCERLFLNCLTCVHLISTKSEKVPCGQGPPLIIIQQLQVYLNSNDLRADIRKILFHQCSRIQLLRCCTHCPELTDILCL